MNEIVVTVQSRDAFHGGALAKARRIDEGQRHAATPVLAFASIDVLARYLTANCWRLLETLRQTGPVSIRRLAGALGRDYRGVHADVGKLLEVGLVERTEDGLIRGPWDRVILDFRSPQTA